MPLTIFETGMSCSTIYSIQILFKHVQMKTTRSVDYHHFMLANCFVCTLPSDTNTQILTAFYKFM